ncbi:MAG: DUF5615 family PIN-like protein [Caulobacteraceae bacterium]|nr:DUF5615 family PIN-like protein [Caulobacteraceae bacterium]
MSPPRFLIDENLSTALPQRAHARSHEATHVTHLGLKGAKDWTLMELIAEEDWVGSGKWCLATESNHRHADFQSAVCLSIDFIIFSVIP